MTDQRGFTVIELLVTMTIGLIVLSAAGRLMVVTQKANARIEGRVDASQRGRTAMEQITQQLRAMVCLPTNPAVVPVAAASPDSITFYADLDGDTVYEQEQRRITAQRDASGNLTAIVEERWVGVAAPSTASPTRRRTLITNIRPVKAPNGSTLPVFRYWYYPANNATTTTQLPESTLAASDLPRIARIDVAFRSLATTRSNADSRQASNMEASVYARTLRRDGDSNQPTFDCNSG